ncbi:mannosyltransferase family protein [Archangium violaceum]|uniref:mannosyltransferase family protein n=1 Tax=Archangium violaceum TaxID=83451 RepID=UPI002B299846|nr:mannosyltransferase family protein [Archangium gephyra]
MFTSLPQLVSQKWQTLPRGARLALWLVGTRLWVWVWMLLGTFFTRPPPRVHWTGEEGSLRWMVVPHRLLDVWGRWDTLFYVDIAQRGYPAPYSEGGWVFHAAFFPLYPALMRGLSELLGGIHVFYVGIFLAQIMLALAVFFFDKLVRLDHSESFAELAVACLLAYPGSHFLSCVYPESLALLLGVLALYCVRTQRRGLGALACALCVLARPNGWLVCLPALYELCRGDDDRLRLSPRVLWLLVPTGAVMLLFLLHWQTYGDPLYFVHVQQGWGTTHFTFPLLALISTNRPPDHNLVALAALLLVVYGFVRRVRPSYPLLAGTNLLLPLCTGSPKGVLRYMGSNFPLFILLARLLEPRPWLRRSLLVLGLTGLAVYSYRWSVGLWPN